MKRIPLEGLSDDANQVQINEPVEVVKIHAPAAAALREGVFIEAAGEPSQGRWQIRVIRAGLSLNGVFYPDAVLREAAPGFEGARVFIKSDAEHIKGAGKDVRNLVGGLRGVRFVEGKTPDRGELQVELVMIEPEGEVNANPNPNPVVPHRPASRPIGPTRTTARAGGTHSTRRRARAAVSLMSPRLKSRPRLRRRSSNELSCPQSGDGRAAHDHRAWGRAGTGLGGWRDAIRAADG